MNWRKALETIMNWWSWVAAVAATIAFMAPLLTAPTDQDPTGGAGLLAPVVALCVAAMILIEAIKAGRLQIRRIPSIFIGLGSIGSAYLWMAAASDAHPLNPDLPVALLILFVISALILTVSLLARGKSRSNGHSDCHGHSDAPLILEPPSHTLTSTFTRIIRSLNPPKEPPPMPNTSPEKSRALQWVDDNQQSLSEFHRQIWDYAEPAWREYRSADAFCNLLESEGFHVERGSGEMPTAFLATYGSGGPILGTYAEYDAVPGNSQQPVPYKAPREGLHPWAAGHTDPHSSLGVAALAGILGAKSAIDRHNLKGTLAIFGEPAEKVCGSKPVHAAKGYYDGFDAFISYHPHPTNTTIWDTHCGSYWSAVFTFECHSPETWVDPELLAGPNHPHSAPRCPGAIDALCLMYTNTKYTKEAMYPHTGTWTLNEFIMAGGQCTSDNLPPRFSQIQYAWRSPTLDIQQRIFNVLENNARRAAEATGCEVSVRWVTKTRVGLPNHAMAQLTYDNLALVGPPVLDEEARASDAPSSKTWNSSLWMTPLPTNASISFPLPTSKNR